MALASSSSLKFGAVLPKVDAILNIGKHNTNILRQVEAMRNDKCVPGVVQHTFHWAGKLVLGSIETA